MYYNVTFTEPGEYKVTVSTDRGPVEVVYEVLAGPGKQADNVIFFIGDGMQQGMISAARLISRGQQHGFSQGDLYLDTMPGIGLQRTSGVDSIITDSANSASSFNTGHKSSVNALGVYADTTSDTLDDPKVETLAERAKRELGKCVGIVTNSEIQDATPAAAWAHTRSRGDKDVIVDQLLNGVDNHSIFSNGNGLQAEVIMGGGGAYFHPPQSLNGTDYYEAFRDAGYTIVHTREELLANAGAEKILGIFHEGNMDVWLDRNVFTDNIKAPLNTGSPVNLGGPADDQPGLVEMTQVALQTLKGCSNGFYLYVEAASIDKQMHPIDVDRALADLIELDETIGVALDFAKEDGNTLVVATGDHGHGFDVFGTVDTEIFNDGTTNVDKRRGVGLYASAGMPNYVDSDGDHFPDSWSPRYVVASGVNNFPTHSEDYQVSPVPRVPAILVDGVFVNNPEDDPDGIFLSGNINPRGSTGVHTLTDVTVFSYGPGSERLTGTYENTRIFFAMAEALGLGEYQGSS